MIHISIYVWDKKIKTIVFEFQGNVIVNSYRYLNNILKIELLFTNIKLEAQGGREVNI